MRRMCQASSTPIQARERAMARWETRGGAVVGGGRGQAAVGGDGLLGLLHALALGRVRVQGEEQQGGRRAQRPGQGGDGNESWNRPALRAHVGAEGTGEDGVDGARRAGQECVPRPHDHQRHRRHDRGDEGGVRGDEDADALADERRRPDGEQGARTTAQRRLAAGVGHHRPQQPQRAAGGPQDEDGPDQAEGDGGHPPQGPTGAARGRLEGDEAAAQPDQTGAPRVHEPRIGAGARRRRRHCRPRRSRSARRRPPGRPERGGGSGGRFRAAARPR